MDDNKKWWEVIASIGANTYSNQVNANAATAQSANNSQAIAGVVKFALVVATAYGVGKFLISLFKK